MPTALVQAERMPGEVGKTEMYIHVHVCGSIVRVSCGGGGI